MIVGRVSTVYVLTFRNRYNRAHYKIVKDNAVDNHNEFLLVYKSFDVYKVS